VTRIKAQAPATAETSTEYLPGYRRDKRYGNVRLDCYLNMTRPSGGMLPGTGIAHWRAPHLATREQDYVRIVAENKQVGAYGCCCPEYPPPSRGAQIEERIRTAPSSIDSKKAVTDYLRMREKLKKPRPKSSQQQTRRRDAPRAAASDHLSDNMLNFGVRSARDYIASRGDGKRELRCWL
jgi:hypothetical protein